MELPIYRKIVEDIKDKINEGLYQHDDRLPTETELMRIYNTSKATIRKALKALSDEGYVTNIYRIGNFIAQPDKKKFILTFDEAEANSDIDNSEVLSIEYLDCKLKLKNHIFDNNKNLVIKSLFKSFEMPVAYEIKYIFFEKAMPQDIKKLNFQSIQNILSKQLNLYSIDKKISISSCHASEKVANSLHIHTGDYVIQAEQYFFDINNKIVAYYDTYYKTSYIKLHAYSR